MPGRVYVREIAPGRYQLRTYHGVDEQGRARVSHETVRGGESDALARAREIEAAFLRGEIGDPNPETVGGFLESHLRRLEAGSEVAASTLRGYRHKKSLVGERVGRIALAKLRPRDLEARYAALLSGDGGRTLSPRTVLHVHRFLFTAFEAAVRLGEMRENPARRAKPPQPKRSHARLDLDFAGFEDRDEDVVVLASGEMARLLLSFRDGSGAARRNPLMFAATFVGYKTGMRRGELAGLAWSAIDLDGAEIDVRRALFWPYGDDRPVIKAPKSGRARRVTLSPDTVATLRTWRAELARIALAAGRPMPSPVFPCLRTFAPLRPERLSKAFASRARLLKLSTTRFHALRHTHASELLIAGEALHVVSKRLGHSDPATTLRIYAHLMPGTDAAVASRIDSVLPFALDQ